MTQLDGVSQLRRHSSKTHACTHLPALSASILCSTVTSTTHSRTV